MKDKISISGPKDENVEALAEKVRGWRGIAHRAVTEGVNLKYVEVLRRACYEACDEADALLARLAEAERGWSECRRIGSHRAREIEELRKLYKELYAAHAAARSGAR